MELNVGGMIPAAGEGWDEVPFGSLYAIPSRNGIYKSPEFHGRGCRIVNMGEMFGYDFVSEQEMPRVSLTAAELAVSSLQDGDLLFGRRSVVEAGAGKCSIVVAPKSALTFESSIIRSRLDHERALPLFYYYYFKSPRGRERIRNIVSGTNVKGIRGTELRDLLVPVPTHDEQASVAAALSDVDALLGSLERLIAKRRGVQRAAMEQLLTGQTRLPGFNRHWEHLRVADVVTDRFCGPSPTCDERNIQGEHEWGVLKTTAITKEHGWDWTKHKTLPRLFWGRSQLELRRGDVVVTKAGPRHRVGVSAWIDFVPPRIIPSGKMIALRPNTERVEPFMLAAAISAKEAQRFLDQRTTGMAESQVNFENDALLATPIYLPSRAEQREIGTAMTDIAAEIAAIEARRDKTKLLKIGMMQELLTGRTRLV